ncbi:5-formyltetrahydrofolate cyclo-ligase [Streptomyces gardneri]|jgi:5-formyltetrahydrofolate cyclo-ligase|uniref:5-formyltetrahydrofolate cyclo-ligase n=1 Tax=Nocardia TaxID=1817 RepID=UPI001356934F|nr:MULTISPECIES: 5-formyltetrahydrofolate cyclo-ligase [Nocardia]MBF6166628.1 5-formyltetrahydrofolate cyclo-ligase [Streptomyces gardneri]MBF6205444.1 5-formyltetrahydrofolate cyclo-ligase [Streptomyces gardneri]
MVITVKMPGERDKHAWRIELLAQRAVMSATERENEAFALATTVGAVGARGWVCAYVPIAGEPGSTAMLDALLAGGARVLLPVTGPPGPLSWAEYTGADALRRARYGLLEPIGAVLPPDAVTRAELILVPALAVDLRGVRLGRGAGYYDRTLPAARPDARLVAVVRDDELLDRLPEEPHDLRMGWALTPRGGLRRLGDHYAGE